MADKYLIAMVLMYFLRAAFRPEEYTSTNFFIALSLAHDMEEEDDETRKELRAFSTADDSPSSLNALCEQRLYLFKRMNYRAVVSRFCCDALMRVTKPSHWVWKRERYPIHAGAERPLKRSWILCPNCQYLMDSDSS